MTKTRSPPRSLGSGRWSNAGDVVSLLPNSVKSVEPTTQRTRAATTATKILHSLKDEDVKLFWREKTERKRTLSSSLSNASTASLCSTEEDDECASVRSSLDVPQHHEGPVPMAEPDVYGQRHPIESPDLVRQKLCEFEDAMQSTESEALLLAQTTCPELLTPAFMLMFLRCECFNVEKASMRYSKYWDKRLELFGPNRAFSPLTMESMESDYTALQAGAVQILERPNDRNLVWVDSGRLAPGAYSREAGVRSFWYLFHALLEDEQVQKQGLVVVNFASNFTNKNRDPVMTRMCIASMQGCLPIRFSGLHFCHPPAVARFAVKLLLCFVGERLRNRVLMYSGGSDDVCALTDTLAEKYGIAKTDIPTELGGQRMLDIDAWLQQRRKAGL